MAVSVVPDLMALLRHAQQQVLIAGNLLADHKKGGVGAPLQKTVQQGGGGVPPGAVVKGQGHVLGLLESGGLEGGLHRPSGIQRSQKHSGQEREKAFHHKITGFSLPGGAVPIRGRDWNRR